MSSLNEAQKQAIEYIEGSLLIVAGAGTGKTTVITKKIAYLIEQKKIPPENILALTFTEKAASEMQTRVDELLTLGYSQIQISTFHAFCQKILEDYGLDIGLPNRFKLLTQTDAWLLIRENLQKFNLDYYKPLGNPTRYIHELVKHFNKCKDELISPKDYLNFAEEESKKTGDMNTEEVTRLKEIAESYHVYNQLLLDSNSLDFGDLIFYTLKLFEERKHILEKIQQRFKYILVDEFQDVNSAQYKLVELLTGKQNHLSVVGDDDQSIYAFRGASVSNILRFKDHYKNAKSIVLTENYRSEQKILDAAYTLIQQNNPDRLEVKLSIDKKLKSNKKSVQEKGVEYFYTETSSNEIQLVIEKINELKQGDNEIKWSDFAILVRANSHAEPFVNAFQKQRLPYEFLASSGLFRQGIILDCYNFFKIIINYHESSAVYRLLCLPCFSFKESDLQKLTYFAKKKSASYYEVLKRSSECRLGEKGVEITEKLLHLIHEGMRLERSEKPSILLYSFLEKSGYLSYLAEEENKGNPKIIQSIQYLRQFFEKITQYETENPGKNSVAGFLEYLSYIIESGDEGNLEQSLEEDTIKLMTVHASKGLEFKYVFIVNLVEDRFPSRRRGEAIEIPLELIKEQLPSGDAHIQEERRLFYVALTRAKEKVFLTSSSNYGGVKQKKPSRFLEEIGFGINEPTISSNSKKTDFFPSIMNDRIDQTLQKTEYEIPRAFSFSQLKSYAACPYQYKLGTIVKIPTKGNAYFSFGTSIHSTLQKFYERIQQLNNSQQISLFDTPVTNDKKSDDSIKIPTLEELIAFYESSFIGDWYKDSFQKEAYYKKGKKILKEFYSAQENNWNIPIILEGWFKIKLGDAFIHGRIDRIDELPDGTLEIIDYKTGESKEKVAGEEKDQLLIYQIATEELREYTHLGKPSKLTFYYLNDNTKVSFYGTPKETEHLKTKFLELIEQIRKGDFTPTPSQFTCTNCDFKDICEYRIL